MLITPLGALEVYADGQALDYQFCTIPTDNVCPNLDGRYAITVTFCPDGQEHSISCKIRNYIPSCNDGQEPGEHLELASFYNRSTKLSIGMEGDTGYLNGNRISEYDYDTVYLPDGVQYCILPMTKTTQYVFGIAWINNVTAENDIQTWVGADLTWNPGR